MFYHVKELQYNARVSKPDPRFARMLLEQFGGCNGELKAAMQYFVQAFGCKNPHPDKYDMLMDIATEEFSHLEIVGATIQMLLTGINGDLKLASETDELSTVLNGKAAKENYIHEAMINPQFFTVTGGGPSVTDSNGNPWMGSYVSAMGDLTVDLRSNMAAESTAKLTYEALMQYTDDVYVKDTLRFLMTREVAHFQMFEAALGTIKPNFPQAILESDPRHSNTYYNLSKGDEHKGPWNTGKSTQMGETWEYVEDPLKLVIETNGLLDKKIVGTERTDESVAKHNDALGKKRSKEIKEATPTKDIVWSEYNKEAKAKK